MFKANNGTRPLVEHSQKIGAAICVRNFLLDMKSRAIDKSFNLNSEEDDVNGLISKIEAGTTINMRQERLDPPTVTEPNSVKMTYTRSNLGKGFVFWFICNICGRRVKFLYFPPNSQILACRKCHRLAYDKQNESKNIRKMRDLLRV